MKNVICIFTWFFVYFLQFAFCIDLIKYGFLYLPEKGGPVPDYWSKMESHNDRNVENHDIEERLKGSEHAQYCPLWK